MRRGIGILTAVVALLFAAGLIVMAFQTLSRSTSRALYSVQEHRQLVNLSRSALAEAIYHVQARLEQGDSSWVDWCATSKPDVKDRERDPVLARKFASGISNDPRFLEYTLDTVTIHRVHGVPQMPGMSGEVGAIDFTVKASVRRSSPAHFARLTLTQRHAFWHSDAPTPFLRGGRHIEILPTPVASIAEVDR